MIEPSAPVNWKLSSANRTSVYTKMWKAALVVAFYFAAGDANECVPYKVNDEVLACVCNATYCDSTPRFEVQDFGARASQLYVTNKQGLRMHRTLQRLRGCQCSQSKVSITVDSTKKYQTIMGFGAAFTDSAGINLQNLSSGAQDQLLRTYYDPVEGSRYTFGRIPIAASDFSPRRYEFDTQVNDVSLKNFSLEVEDLQYKIPFLQKALEINPQIRLFGAAWSAPGWMKTNRHFNGFGYLEKRYYETYAKFLVKFLDEYEKHGINLWALSTGNEPNIAFQVNMTVISMGWTPETMAEWVGQYLGPTLAQSGHQHTHVLALDDDRYVLPGFVKPIFSDERASKVTMGTAVHWYFGNKAPITVLDETHNQFPNKFLLMTEASLLPSVWGDPDVVTKAWDFGEKYILSMIENFNHWIAGWVDWNLALDEHGGPNRNHVSSSAAIIVNANKNEFYKLPQYYAMKHFSRFVDRGSVRISVTDTDTIKSTAFLTPSNNVVVVMYNRSDSKQRVILKHVNKRGNRCLELSPYSMNTLIYKQ